MTNQQSYSMTRHNNNTHQQAAAAYGMSKSGNMTGFEVTSELYKGMIRFTGQAKNAYEAGRMEDMCEYIQKINRVLVALQSNLNFEEGGEAAVFLNDFYLEVFKKLFSVLKADDPVAEFDSVRDLLAPAAELWESHAQNAKKGTPDTHVAHPVIPNQE